MGVGVSKGDRDKESGSKGTWRASYVSQRNLAKLELSVEGNHLTRGQWWLFGLRGVAS